MEDYGKQLANQSQPGYSVRHFVGESISLSPEKYLFYCSEMLNQRWEHYPESTDKDIIQSAEEMVKKDSFNGDCEDYAVLIMSFCRLKEIDALFCLGQNTHSKDQGHVWIEIPICKKEEFTSTLHERISSYLTDGLSITLRKDAYYLSFISKHDIKNYKLEYMVNINGELITTK